MYAIVCVTEDTIDEVLSKKQSKANGMISKSVT